MSVHTLPEGTKLLDYRITGLLGEGGFGIVYLAFDEALERRVALKEYLPSSIASRASQSMTVLLKSENHREAFALGLKSFVNEARLLARFDHPSLVKVHRFWEENGTAYMVMPFYERADAQAHARRARPAAHRSRAAALALAAARCALGAARGALLPSRYRARQHRAHCDRPGAAGLRCRAARYRRHDARAHGRPQAGFAPIEQYGDSPSMTQGAWTDIYALAAVVYAAISGHRPEPRWTGCSTIGCSR